MSEIVQLPVNLLIRARMLAIELRPRTWTIRHRQIRWEAGRVHEELMAAGFQRWEAVRAHDGFITIATNRLHELDRQKGRPVAPVTIFERKTA
ncbi:hypothetical protein PDO_2977 [Rhizobium sp. PDO1-076]|uniref:hypothetical protein n=1 Tax=Rhizobium sp. PDO1-076 TaxID=1125979 RepID=UPI00024E2D94|nr:hypothetical protein [Rhizobium sp. PDO1-076]EHS49770.1 hypothetical protein PDO_2977 [Rhizobium sp. PDO1-076]